MVTHANNKHSCEQLLNTLSKWNTDRDSVYKHISNTPYYLIRDWENVLNEWLKTQDKNSISSRYYYEEYKLGKEYSEVKKSFDYLYINRIKLCLEMDSYGGNFELSISSSSIHEESNPNWQIISKILNLVGKLNIIPEMLSESPYTYSSEETFKEMLKI